MYVRKYATATGWRFLVGTKGTGKPLTAFPYTEGRGISSSEGVMGAGPLTRFSWGVEHLTVVVVDVGLDASRVRTFRIGRGDFFVSRTVREESP